MGKNAGRTDRTCLHCISGVVSRLPAIGLGPARTIRRTRPTAATAGPSSATHGSAVYADRFFVPVDLGRFYRGLRGGACASDLGHNGRAAKDGEGRTAGSADTSSRST